MGTVGPVDIPPVNPWMFGASRVLNYILESEDVGRMKCWVEVVIAVTDDWFRVELNVVGYRIGLGSYKKFESIYFTKIQP